MGKGRLEAFSDGVIAIIITIMVLELKMPHSADLSALWELRSDIPELCFEFRLRGNLLEQPSSLVSCGEACEWRQCFGQICISLFWLSLFPFTTGWMGENHFATWPVIIYGMNLMLAAMAYSILVRCHHCNTWQGFRHRQGHRLGLQGQCFRCGLRRGNRRCLLQSLDFRRPLHCRCADVVHSRSPH